MLNYCIFFQQGSYFPTPITQQIVYSICDYLLHHSMCVSSQQRINRKTIKKQKQIVSCQTNGDICLRVNKELFFHSFLSSFLRGFYRNKENHFREVLDAKTYINIYIKIIIIERWKKRNLSFKTRSGSLWRMLLLLMMSHKTVILSFICY